MTEILFDFFSLTFQYGKRKMVYQIICWIWIFWGIYFFLRPKAFKNHFQRKSLWKIRRYLLAALYVWGGPFFTFLWEKAGSYSKIFTIFGMIFLIKFVFSLTRRGTERLVTWAAEKSPRVFRFLALIQVVSGVVFSFVERS